MGRILCTVLGRGSPKRHWCAAEVDCYDRLVLVNYFCFSSVCDANYHGVGLSPCQPLHRIPLAYLGSRQMEWFGYERRERMKIMRSIVMLEAAAFLAAALTHFGLLIDGYRHRQAANAESVIGCVLLIGWIITLVRPSLATRSAVGAQSFAVFGTLVGVFTIVVGVGPRTMPDIIYHACILTLLLSGLGFSIYLWKSERESQK